MTEHSFFFDASRCSGCMACVVASQDQNDYLTGDTVAFRYVYHYEEGVYPEIRIAGHRGEIHFAGDASQAFNRVTGQHDWLGTWGNACSQRRTAGQSMAGCEAFFPASLPENISLLFEWSFAQLGDIQPKTGEVRHLACGDPERAGYSLLAFSNGFLTGANLINCTHLSGKLSRAILRKWHCESMLGRADGDFTEAAVEEILNECTASF